MTLARSTNFTEMARTRDIEVSGTANLDGEQVADPCERAAGTEAPVNVRKLAVKEAVIQAAKSCHLLPIFYSQGG